MCASTFRLNGNIPICTDKNVSIINQTQQPDLGIQVSVVRVMWFLDYWYKSSFELCKSNGLYSIEPKGACNEYHR